MRLFLRSSSKHPLIRCDNGVAAPRMCRLLSSSDALSSESTFLEGFNLEGPECNVTPAIASRVGMNLHLRSNHPLYIIKHIIQDYWNQRHGGFEMEQNLSPIVSVQDNFDSLLIPPDHVSRSKSDTYYLNDDTVLRCHTSAHQTALLRRGLNRFLVTGDVYRRDEVDSSHYPVFHQMEGVKLFTQEDYGDHKSTLSDAQKLKFIQDDLKRSLEGMTHALFGNVQIRWVDEYFPFTDPSFELEIYYQEEWMEVLGCGVIRQEIIHESGRQGMAGWAFGLGLERLAMVLFGIPDIRLFWTKDERFHKQFTSGKIVTFQPYSKFPPCFKDISFWTPEQGFHPNDLHEVVRSVAGDLVEKVELIDSFVHPKTERLSNCFRISYRSIDRSLTNDEIDALQEQVRTLAVEQLHVDLR